MNWREQIKDLDSSITDEHIADSDVWTWKWLRSNDERAKFIKNLHDRFYCKNNLKIISSTSSKVGRCIEVGSAIYARQDEKPLTEQDIAVLNRKSYGQSTYTLAKPGDLQAVLRWECDSSD